MASTFNLSNVTALLIANQLNNASYFAGASLKLYDGIQPNAGVNSANYSVAGQNLIATFTLPSAVSNTTANGTNTATITFGAISNVTAIYSSTATWFRITNGANTICDGSVGTSACDLNMNTNVISSGATISLTSFVYTVVE